MYYNYTIPQGHILHNYDSYQLANSVPARSLPKESILQIWEINAKISKRIILIFIATHKSTLYFFLCTVSRYYYNILTPIPVCQADSVRNYN